FSGDGSQGIWPSASLIFDASGDLYGTTTQGRFDYGTVFELTPKAGGRWAFKVLHTFKRRDGNTPRANLIFDTSGNLYGTTYYGPAQSYGGPCHDGTDLGCGTAFELTPKTGGGWTENILHHFKSNGNDGFHPSTSLIFDASGNFYGTTAWGGVSD